MQIRTKRYYIYYLGRVIVFFLAILPIQFGRRLADSAGRLSFAILKKTRKRALNNLRSAFPEKSDAELEKIGKTVFCNLARNIIEVFNTYKLDKKNFPLWATLEGFDKLERELEKGKGVVLLASHVGNWELIPFCFKLAKDYPSTIIVRRVYFHKYDKLLEKMRGSRGVNIIYRDESPKKVLRALKRNEPVGLLADQDMASLDGIFVDFFGKPAYTTKAPALLAMASGAPLMPCFMIREKNRDRHRFIIQDPIELAKGPDKEENVRINTQRWSTAVEKFIRKHPDQWVWMHRRWKTRPEDRGVQYAFAQKR